MNLQDYEFEFLSEDVKKLETRPRDTNPHEKGFDTLKKKMKQKVKWEKGFEYLTQIFESLIWDSEEQAKNTSNI